VSRPGLAPWDGGVPAASPTLEQYILAALAATVLALRDRGDCRDCGRDRPCRDHGADAGLADAYEAAYMQVAAGSAAYADFTIALKARMS